jgi:acetyl esterase/lipase
MRLPLLFGSLLIAASAAGQTQKSSDVGGFVSVSPQQAFPVERNVIYGMYSGLALLMDVHHPQKSNGYGIIFISGSGFFAPLSYDATPLKDYPQVQMYAKPLLDAGYTVFAIDHRFPPRFRHPAAVEDSQRAVRYIRYHAKQFGIRPDRIGAAGGSAGAYLADMLGVLDGKGDPDDSDPVNRESAKVQAVVARAAPIDFINLVNNRAPFVDIMGMRVENAGKLLAANSVEYKAYKDASPLSHITKDAPPFLLMHGDADELVQFKNSEVMAEALKNAGVEVKLLVIPGGHHGPDFPGAKNPPDYLGEMVRWFDQYLRTVPNPRGD